MMRLGYLGVLVVLLGGCSSQPAMDGWNQFVESEHQGFVQTLTTVGQQSGSQLGTL